MMKVRIRPIVLAVALAALAACGGGDQPEPSESAPAAPGGDELTAFQLEHGIGPITDVVELGEPDHELAEQGEQLFALKCTACHKLGERYIGPPLGTVLDRRSPAYVMNMMLNPTEMTQRHPDAKALLAEYLAPMPNQDLSQQDARAVLEYLRLAEAEEVEGEDAND